MTGFLIMIFVVHKTGMEKNDEKDDKFVVGRNSGSGFNRVRHRGKFLSLIHI